MIIWVDAQLPPTLAVWLVETFGVTAFSLKEYRIITQVQEFPRVPS
jgi:predicted nuclease of predicted toxin-antitoxin system